MNILNLVITLLIVYSASITLAFIGLFTLDNRAFDKMLEDIFRDGYEEEKEILRERFEWHRIH